MSPHHFSQKSIHALPGSVRKLCTDVQIEYPRFKEVNSETLDLVVILQPNANGCPAMQPNNVRTLSGVDLVERHAVLPHP
jgi:hypothetical protein